MTLIRRGVDQWIVIGREIFVSPTDVDARMVRVIARGRMSGGAEDGATFHSTHELSKGQSFSIGPNIVVTLIDVAGNEASFGVLASPSLPVQAADSISQ
jgi:sRNA-binding carbon storage regulator CsrA